MNFGELQKEERFRKLKRKLKQSVIGLEQNKGSASPPWSNLSSIHPDGLDSTGPIKQRYSKEPRYQEQDSRVGSEVIASSNNLRKLLLHKNIHGPGATSSVKKFNPNEVDQDRAIMPPPVSNFVSPSMKNVPKFTAQSSQGDIKNYDACSKSSLKGSETNFDKNNSESQQGLKVFDKWRLMLNKEGQLIIKGTIEDGVIARSKPVRKRLSSTQVQSVFNHLYILNGKIVDERRELPDYVREKFLNGFPDDWENIYQLWKNYVSQGSKVTFRWPTPVTDSDDDLVSEVTDFIYKNKTSFQSREQSDLIQNKSAEENSSLGYHSKNSSGGNQIVSGFKKEEDQKNSEAQAMYNKKIENSNSSNEMNASFSNKYKTNHDSKDSFNCSSNLNNTSYYDIIKEDKLRNILLNLSEKNCPQHYLQKFVDSIEFIKHLSYLPDNFEPEGMKHNTSNKSQPELGQKFQNSTPNQDKQESVPVKPVNDSFSVNEVEQVKKCNRPLNFEQIEHSNEPKEKSTSLKPLGSNDGNDSSDSENYMGIPHVPLDGLLHQNAMKSSNRYKVRKNRVDKKSSSKSKSAHKQINNEDQKSQYQVDSSVSITDDEFINENQRREQPHEEQKMSLPTSPIKKEKQKPFIKSFEEVSYNLDDLRYQSKVKNFSDIDSSSKTKKQIPPNKKSSKNEGVHAEELSNEEELKEHPFLTFDSDNFMSDDSEGVCTSIHKTDAEPLESDVLKTQKSNVVEKTNTEAFGSKDNPKLLSAWVPCVMYDHECRKSYGLAFEGKLLNEAGHILDRKFLTKCVSKKHSSKLIETVDNQFFMLKGELYDAKHVIPKELQKYCRSGCPTKIKEFCLRWKKHNLLIDSSINEDEKPADPVSNEDLNKIRDEQFQKNNSELNTNYLANKNNVRSIKTEKVAKPASAQKRQKVERTFTSNSESDDREPESKKIRNPPVKRSGRKGHRTDSKKVIRHHSNTDILTESAYNSKSRKTVETNLKESVSSPTRRRSQARTNQPKVEWTFGKEQKNKHKDELSEDEASIYTR